MFYDFNTTDNSSSLNENPIGSLILTKPEKINNDPTNILKILTKIFILLI